MNTLEAIQQARTIAPNRSFIVSKSVQVMHQYRDDAPIVSYSISVQPGYDMTPCQIFYGNSFEACIALFIATASPSAGEPNDE